MARDLVNHDLLSYKASKLDEDPLTAQAEIAEVLLKLQASYTGTEEVKAVLGIVTQVNFQLEQGDLASVYQQVKDGEIDSRYRDQSVSSRATAIVADLTKATLTVPRDLDYAKNEAGIVSLR